MTQRQKGHPATLSHDVALVIVLIAALLLATATVLVFNGQHSGHPGKVRRELRKF